MVLCHLYLPSFSIPIEGKESSIERIIKIMIEGANTNTTVISVSPSFLVFFMYAALYMVLDPTLIGASTTIYLYGLHYCVRPFCQYFKNPSQGAIVLQVLSWYMQIHPGHAVYEKRKPALMDSFVQAFAFAPLFVWYEILFRLGIRKEFHAHLVQVVNEKRKPWLEQQKKKAT